MSTTSSKKSRTSKHIQESKEKGANKQREDQTKITSIVTPPIIVETVTDAGYDEVTIA